MKIEITGLSKSIGDKKILDNVSLEVSPSKITVLLGANGAGKSSLLRAGLGLANYDSGDIKIGNKPIKEYSAAHKSRLIGYLAQNVRPEWNMRAKDLVTLGRMPQQNLGQTNNKLDEQAVRDAIKRLEIEHLAEMNVHEISGGELSLCLLARVLAGEPSFIFADEPFNHLDIKHQLLLLRAFKEFSHLGGGALIVVHDITMAARLGDEFALMKKGEIIKIGSITEALSDENLFLAYEERLSLRETNGQYALLTQ